MRGARSCNSAAIGGGAATGRLGDSGPGSPATTVELPGNCDLCLGKNRRMKLPRHLVSVLSLFALVAATPTTFTDYSIVMGPPMKTVILQGTYVDAITIAYAAWLSPKTRPSLASQKVTVSPEPGTQLLYVRFVPMHSKVGYDGDVLYVIDLGKRKIVRRAFGT
jgi:hypothetical protein